MLTGCRRRHAIWFEDVFVDTMQKGQMMRRRRFVGFVGWCALMCFCVAAWGETLYVGPEGNDAWSGKTARAHAGTDGPMATVSAAVAALRKVEASRPREIILTAGEYYLDRPIVLDERDSGLVIRGAEGGKVYLFGGKQVTGWRPDGDGLYAAMLPEVKAGEWDFRAIVVNGRLCERSRLPEAGTFVHASEFNVSWMSTTGGGWQRKPTAEELTTMKYRPEDIGAWFDSNNAEITVYHMWDESMVGVSGIDRENHRITFSSPAGHPPGAFGVKKYVLWNLREGMTRPGQWYLDRTAGKVVYRPMPKEDMKTATILAPTMESIIRIRGSAESPAENITIRGLCLSITGTPLVAGGFGAGRFDGAVDLSNARDCKLLDLEVFNVAGQGIKARGPGLEVRGCHIHNTGACGLRFGSDNAQIIDNHIHHIGRMYPSAIGLQSSGNNFLVRHNAIHDTPYSAVTGGGRDNLYEYNLMYHAMQELHDGAGIYIFGGKGVVIRSNFIRDIIDTGGYGASAYYLDETCEGCTVEGNLSVGIARPSHNHMAKSNTIRNNVFVIEGDATLTWARSSEYTFEKNIVRATGSITFSNFGGITTFRDNLLYSGTGRIIGEKMSRYSAEGSAAIKAGDGNVFADPLLTEYGTGRVAVSAESPAVKMDISLIDVSSAGPRRR